MASGHPAGMQAVGSLQGKPEGDFAVLLQIETGLKKCQKMNLVVCREGSGASCLAWAHFGDAGPPGPHGWVPSRSAK